MSISESDDGIKEVRIGDGAYVLDGEGDVRPLSDFDLRDSAERSITWDDEDDWGDDSMPSEELDGSEALDETRETQQQRLRDFKRKNGFYPSSVEELNYAHAVDTVDAARYLNRVLWHQKEVASGGDEVARKTLLSIAGKFVHYKTSAAADAHFLGELGRDVADAPSADWAPILHISGDKRAIIDIMRHSDLELFAGADDTKSRVGLKKYDEYYKAADGFLAGISSKEELLALTQGVYAQQIARTEFWTERLRQTTRHGVVTTLAKKALGESL